MTDFERFNFDVSGLEIINKELSSNKDKKIEKSDYMKNKIKDLKDIYKERE